MTEPEASEELVVKAAPQLLQGEPIGMALLPVSEVSRVCLERLVSTGRLPLKKDQKVFVVMSIVTDDTTHQITHVKIDAYPARGEG